jgi:hypothetical protein
MSLSVGKAEAGGLVIAEYDSLYVPEAAASAPAAIAALSIAAARRSAQRGRAPLAEAVR